MDALVARIGDEILARVDRSSEPRLAPESGRWQRPSGGYAAAIESVALGGGITAGPLDAACAQAAELGVRAIWTASSWTPRAYRRLSGSAVRIGAAIGFPFGDSTPAAKCAEAETAVASGAQELLTTLNAGAWLSGERDRAYADLLAVCELASAASIPVTVALDLNALEDSELVRAAIAAELAGAKAIQCSGGWPSRVRRLAEAVGDDLVVGAAVDADSFASASGYAAAGARRLAVSKPEAVLRGAPRS